jgi:gamma-aminobutyric acid type B receptor
MQSFGGTYDGSGSIPGVELALDTINNDSSILPGYTLHYVLRDSFCERTTALQSLHRLLFEDPVKIAIMGSGCSPATEPTAEIDHYYNLTHISCVSSSIALSNRTRYRAYYQMLPSESDIATAIFGAIREYGWGYIAIITQNENILTLTIATLGEKLQAMHVQFTERRFETRDGVRILHDNGELFDPNARIFFIATFSSHARDIICLAHRAGYRYPQYMFLTYAWYRPQWWEREGSPDFNCTAEDRLRVLNNTLAFLHFPFVRFGDVNASTDVQFTGYEYMQEVEEYVARPPLNISRVIAGAGFCHDATWTLALALNRTMTELEESDTLREKASNASGLSSLEFSLEDFTYQNYVIQGTMLRHLYSTNFTGVTGGVKFKEGIRDVDALRVLQIQKTTGVYDWVKIATVIIDDDNENSTNVRFFYVNGFTDGRVFQDGVPHDGIPERTFVTIHLSLTIIIAVLVALGLGFTIVCLVFNTIFRQRKLIRLSSPNLNYLICAGAIILYLDMILLVIPSTDMMVVTVLCNLNPWFTSIGYSLCYGTILVKMLRVYYIYSNPSPRKKNTKIIKDEILILIVFCMVIIDLIILCVYFGVEGWRGNLEARRVRNAENEQEVKGVS